MGQREIVNSPLGIPRGGLNTRELGHGVLMGSNLSPPQLLPSPVLPGHTIRSSGTEWKVEAESAFVQVANGVRSAQTLVSVKETWIDTGLKVQLTSKCAGSSFLLLTQVAGVGRKDSAQFSSWVQFQIRRNGTAIMTFGHPAAFLEANSPVAIGTVDNQLIDRPNLPAGALLEYQVFIYAPLLGMCCNWDSGSTSTICLIEIAS